MAHKELKTKDLRILTVNMILRALNLLTSHKRRETSYELRESSDERRETSYETTPFFAKQTQFPKSQNEPNYIHNNSLRKIRHLVELEKQSQFKPNFKPAACCSVFCRSQRNRLFHLTGNLELLSLPSADKEFVHLFKIECQKGCLKCFI